MENDVIQQHTDKRRVCSERNRLSQLDQARYLTFYGQSDGADYVCSPPLVFVSPSTAPGSTSVGVCQDTKGNKATIHEQYVGRERRSVGGVSIDVVHVVGLSQLSGRANGKASDELWLAADDGMVVSWHRWVDTDANAAFGANVHYSEHATLDLESISPHT
jgi:hypothetical protein